MNRLATILIRWLDMRASSIGKFVNDATVTFVVLDAAGTPVSAASGSLTYTGTPGHYQGSVESTITFIPCDMYYVEVTAAGTGSIGFRRVEECVAGYQDAG